MFKKAKSFTAGIIVGSIVATSIGVVFAEPTERIITAVYNGIKIYMNSNLITVKDANGNDIEPFISEGTTYLPVRGIANAFGKIVTWNEKTNSIAIYDDQERPSVNVSAPTPREVVEGGSITFTIKAAHATGRVDFNLDDTTINLNGFMGEITVAGSGNERELKISNLRGIGIGKTISLNEGAVTSPGGNVAFATPNTATFAITSPIGELRPSVNVSPPIPRITTAGGRVTFEITAAHDSQNVNFNLNENTISINGFTGDMDVSGSGNTRTITFTNVQGIGSGKSIALRAGALSSPTGKNNFATPNTATFKIIEDVEKPNVSVSVISSKEVIEGRDISFSIHANHMSGELAFNLDESTIMLNGFTAEISVSGMGNSRILTLRNVQGVGTVKSIALKHGAVTSPGGNANLATPNSAYFTIHSSSAEDMHKHISISEPKYKDDEVTLIVTYGDDVEHINLTNELIVLHDCYANIKISGEDKERIITISKISVKETDFNEDGVYIGPPIPGGQITIVEGSGIKKDGGTTPSVTSSRF